MWWRECFGEGPAIGNGKVEVTEGELGGGKSYRSALQVYDWVTRGGVAAGNVAVKWEDLKRVAFDRDRLLLDDRQWIRLDDEQVSCFERHTPPQSLILLDELHLYFNARDHASTNKKGEGRDTLNFITQARKDWNNLVIISQSALNVDRQFNRMVRWVWRCRNAENMIVPGIGLPLPFPWFVWNRYERDGRTFVKQYRVTKDPQFYEIYDTEEKYCQTYSRLESRSVRVRQFDPARQRGRVFYGDLDGGLLMVPGRAMMSPRAFAICAAIGAGVGVGLI